MSIRLIPMDLSSLLIFHPCRSQERGVKEIRNAAIVSASLINLKVQFY